MFHLDTATLLASVLWSGVGTGYWVYGKKQSAMPPMVGGIALIGVSCLITGAWMMSLASIAVIVGTHLWMRHDN